MPLGVVRADDDVEELLERQVGEGQPHRLAPLRRDDAEPPPLLLQRRQDIRHARTLGELGVQRLVVLAVAGDELVDPLGRDQAHLLDQPGASDRAPELLVGDVAAEHGLRRVPHRRDDDRAGVDHGAVEVEENDREAHGFDRTEASVLDALEVQPPGGAVCPPRCADDPRAAAPAPGLRASSRRGSGTMWRRKLTASIVKWSSSPCSSQAAARTVRSKGVLGLRRREGGEVVRPGQERRGGVERIAVERPGHHSARPTSNGERTRRRRTGSGTPANGPRSAR